MVILVAIAKQNIMKVQAFPQIYIIYAYILKNYISNMLVLWSHENFSQKVGIIRLFKLSNTFASFFFHVWYSVVIFVIGCLLTPIVIIFHESSSKTLALWFYLFLSTYHKGGLFFPRKAEREKTKCHRFVWKVTQSPAVNTSSFSGSLLPQPSPNGDWD